jgi:hypothetical protein
MVGISLWDFGRKVSSIPIELLNRTIDQIKDEHQLTVGQLQWLDYDLFLPALKPFFLSTGVSESNVDRILQEAQRDLYYPSTPYSSLIHVVYAVKRNQGHLR